jgi:hypothetical protein
MCVQPSRVPTAAPTDQKKSRMNIYVLREPERPPWGDYGHVLLSGLSSLPRKDGLYQLERTGPFVPPISMPFGAVVVTDEFRERLEKSTLTGLTFQPIIKSRIVHLDWQNWDKSAEDPEQYPATGEPEDYVLGQPHSPDTAAKIGALWELCLGEHAEIIRVPRNPSELGLVKWAPFDATHDTLVVLSSWDGTDWFMTKPVGHTYVSERAKTWLEQTTSEWVSFEPALTR